MLEHDVLKQLLIKEEQIRLSRQTQQLLSSIEHRTDIDWMDVIDQLQTQLIKEEIGDDATDQEIQHGLRYTHSLTLPLLLYIISVIVYLVF